MRRVRDTSTLKSCLSGQASHEQSGALYELMAKTYSPPVLTPEKEKGVAAGEFDFLLPLAKNLWRTDEVAGAIGRSMQYVRQLVEEGRLEAYKDSACGGRKSSLITRRSLVLYFAETANHDPSFHVIRIEVLLSNLTPAALDRLIAKATKLRNQLGR